MVMAASIWRDFAAVIETLAQADRQPRVILLHGNPATILASELNEAIRHAGTSGRVIIIHSREV